MELLLRFQWVLDTSLNICVCSDGQFNRGKFQHNSFEQKSASVMNSHQPLRFAWQLDYIYWIQRFWTGSYIKKSVAYVLQSINFTVWITSRSHSIKDHHLHVKEPLRANGHSKLSFIYYELHCCCYLLFIMNFIVVVGFHYQCIFFGGIRFCIHASSSLTLFEENA